MQIRNRLPTRQVKRKERMSVLFTNLLIIVVVLVADRFIGWRTYLQIQLPVLCYAGAAGIWLFYVQHQSPGGYWARKSEWEPLRAAMEGCSFYKLPAVLRWFSSNIGIPPCPPPEPQNSQLPSEEVLRCRSGAARKSAAHNGENSFLYSAKNVG